VTTLEGVAVVDLRDPIPAFVTALAVGLDPKGVALDEQTNRVFVAVTGDPPRDELPSLVTIDGLERVVKTSVPLPPEVGGAGVGVAFNPNDRLVYVAIPAWGLAVYDPETEQFVATIPIVGDQGAGGTYGVVVDARTNLVFATNRAEGTLSIVNAADFKELDRLAVGALPEWLGIDADRGIVYVANSGVNTLSFIHQDPKTSRFTVFATLVVGPAPKAAAVDPGSGRVYVPAFEDDRVRVVQP
jgi:DNA-binding beta-propeller fold protein YncE